jgi:putative transposase
LRAARLPLVESKGLPDHLRCLLSLRPDQCIATVIKTIKSVSSHEMSLAPPVWERGYLARSTGRVRTETVKRYLDAQAEHHGYAGRLLPPVFRWVSEQPVALTAAHASFELNHHLVFATQRRKGVFDSVLGEALGRYWIRVAAKRGFAVDRISIVPDHAHLLVRIVPKMSIEECALSLLNNGQQFVGKHAPDRLIEAGIEGLWQGSAYAGTVGDVTTALVKAYLSHGG